MKNLTKWLFPSILLAIPIIAFAIIIWIIFTPNISNNLTVVSGFAVAAATLELAIVAYIQIYESKENLIKSEQPIIIPNGRITYSNKFWSDTHFELLLANVGRGAALDVWSVILPPENPRISTDNIFTYRSERPYIPIEVRQAKFDKGGTVFLPTTKIENIQMGVPKGSEPETGIPNSTDRRDRCVLRMTITYRDIYGRKYLHMFDYSQLNEWITVSFKQDISKDIDNLDKLS